MTGATRIIAIRHGETAWNVETRLQGHLDIGLNERGQWQAERAAEALADEEVAAIYSSDLTRAFATATAISNRNTSPGARPVHAHTGLRERGFGIFEGVTWAPGAPAGPWDGGRGPPRDPNFAPRGGESLIQVRDRIASTVNILAGLHVGEQIVLVAHGGVMDALYRLATRQDIESPRTWDLGNASINRLLWTPDGLSLVGWSDTRHLDDATLDETTT
jgi:probable phosphoglycerate mutase